LNLMGFCAFSKVVLWFNEAAVQDGLKDLASVLVEDIKEAGQGTRGLTAPEQFRSVKGFVCYIGRCCRVLLFCEVSLAT